MSFAPRLKTAAAAAVAGTALSAVSMVGFSGTANAESYLFELCIGGNHDVAVATDGRLTQYYLPGPCRAIGGIEPGSSFQLRFNLPGGAKATSKILYTSTKTNTTVVTGGSTGYKVHFG